MKVQLHREARLEIEEAFGYHAEIDPEHGRRFFDEIDRVIPVILANPRNFRIRP